MKIFKKIGLVFLVLLVVVVVKLKWFPSPFNQEIATESAFWKLEKASKELQFDFRRFGKPDEVVGRNNKDGYSFHWFFNSESEGRRLSVIVAVSPWDIDFTGIPFILDCREQSINEIRQRGFGYLCINKN